MVAAIVAPVSLTSAPRTATRPLRAGAAAPRAARVVAVRASAEERQVRAITRDFLGPPARRPVPTATPAPPSS